MPASNRPLHVLIGALLFAAGVATGIWYGNARCYGGFRMLRPASITSPFIHVTTHDQPRSGRA
jgi:hypothetical protein